MSRRKYKFNQTLSQSQILAKVKRQMYREQQILKTQENLLYLNNSFNNNIQCQEIFIDLKKGKKKKLKSQELKMMYTLFSDNKANTCIFEKIAEKQLKRIKMESGVKDSSINKWAKDTKGMMEIIEEEQVENLGQMVTNNNLTQEISVPTQNQQDTSRKLMTSRVSRSSFMNAQKSSIFERSSFHFQTKQESKQVQFLVKRIYCRLIQKILVKIAFYTMNTKYLDGIAVSMLEITRNLQTMIRRLSQVKDTRLLQQTILKVYKQNITIQNKIFQLLVNGGYIMSVDEFYRINGIDAVHKDVYELKNPDELMKKYKPTIKEKVQKNKQQKEKVNIVKKDHIVRANNQINEKYMFCVSQIKQILEEDNKQNQVIKTTPEKKKPQFSKTQPIPKNPSIVIKKPSRFASGFGIGKIIEKESTNKPSDSQDQQQYLISTSPKSSKPKLSYQSRFSSSFSHEFSKIIRESESTKKLQRKSALSEQFMEFNELDIGRRKKSKNHSDVDSVQFEKPMRKDVKKKTSQEMFTIGAINKLLRLYQSRNTDRYSIDSFFSSTVGLPPELRQSLRLELMKLQSIYNANSPRDVVERSSLHLSQTASDGSKSQMNHRYDNGDQEFSDSQKVTLSSNQLKRFTKDFQRGLKKSSTSKEDYNFHYHYHRDIQSQDITIEPDSMIEKGYHQKEFTFTIQRSSQNSLIKLSKDRVKRIKTSQKIRSSNLHIFTPIGVKNLQATLKNQQMPFKNEKLKRIPYIKNRQKMPTDFKSSNNIKANQEYNLNETDPKHQKRQISSGDSKPMEYPKILRKAYQNSTLSMSGQCFHKKTVQQIVQASTKTPDNSLQKRIKQRKQRSLHKFATIYEQSRQNSSNQKRDTFRTLYPRWMSRTTHVNSVQQQSQKFIERDKKICTAVYQSSSEPISPRNHQNKENGFPFVYEVYDIRYRKKVQVSN